LPNSGITWGPDLQEIVEGVWTRVTRELTNLPTVRAEKIDKLDALISSRANGADYTASRAAKLDNLDASITSRFAASLMPPDRAAKVDNLDTTISSRQPDVGLSSTHVNRLDANISSRQPDVGLTATHVGRIDTNISSRAAASDYTPARAAKLDNLDIPVSNAKNVVTVQRGITTLDYNNKTVNVSISSVNTQKSFVNISSGFESGSTDDFGIFVRGRLTSGTNLELQRTSGSDVDTFVAWEVIQIA